MSRHLLKTLGYLKRSDGGKTKSFDILVPWSKIRGAKRDIDSDVVMCAEGLNEIYIIMPFEEFEEQFEAYLASVKEQW